MIAFDKISRLVLNCLDVRAAGFFLRVLLGPANVRATRKDGRYKVKEEYNAYRVGLLTSPRVPCFVAHSNILMSTLDVPGLMSRGFDLI